MEIIDGRYQIICELGIDKFTAVYRARDLEMLRDVTLKILRVKYFNASDILKLFLREASIHAHLNHPAIPPLYSFGHSDGLPYFAMKYLSGASLQTRLKVNGPLPPYEAVALINQLADALNFLHKKGFVYRYLKSGNIRFDSLNQPYLINFFITYHEAYREIFSEFSFMGPAHAMAPEQWQLHTPTKQVDIYQLGILAFEILSGKLPIRAATAGSYYKAHLEQPVPPITTIKPELPQICNGIFLKVLAKDPPCRYDTAVDFANALSQAFNQ